MPCVARRLSRRAFEVFRFGTAIATAHDSRRGLEPVAQLRERGPARVSFGFLVYMPLAVQILAAHRAEASALRAAQDLLRQRQCERVARPLREIDAVVGGVR